MVKERENSKEEKESKLSQMRKRTGSDSSPKMNRKELIQRKEVTDEAGIQKRRLRAMPDPDGISRSR